MSINRLKYSFRASFRGVLYYPILEVLYSMPHVRHTVRFCNTNNYATLMHEETKYLITRRARRKLKLKFTKFNSKGDACALLCLPDHLAGID